MPLCLARSGWLSRQALFVIQKFAMQSRFPRFLPEWRGVSTEIQQLLGKTLFRSLRTLLCQFLAHGFNHDGRHACAFKFGTFLDQPNGLFILDVERSHWLLLLLA